MSAEEEQVVTVEVDVEPKDETPNGGVEAAESETAAPTAAEETTANGGTAAATEEQPAGADAGGEDSGTEDVVEANGRKFSLTLRGREPFQIRENLRQR